MIKYRPHRGGLTEAMAEEKKFNNIEEMLDFIVEEWNKSKNLFNISDLVISDNKGKDDRINWNETRHICVKRMENEVYDVPQCIGYCSIEED